MNREEYIARLCDDYCRWPRECTNLETLEKTCAGCRMVADLEQMQKRTEKKMGQKLLPGLKIMALTLFIRSTLDLHISFSWLLSMITALLAGVLGLLDWLGFWEE